MENKINFNEFLECCDKEIAVAVTRSQRYADCPKIREIVATSEDDFSALNDRLGFYQSAFRYIQEFPQCRQMFIEGMKRYESTGVKFDICRNFNEYPTGEAPADFLPLVLYFPESN